MPRRGHGKPELARSGRFDLLPHDSRKLLIRRIEGKFPVLVDQLVAELRLPRPHGCPGSTVGDDARGAYEQQGIRFSRLLLVELTLMEQILSRGTQCGRQRIVGSQRAFEIGGPENDLLGLEDDGVLAALDVDGAASGSMGTFIGNDGIRATPLECLAPGLVHTMLHPVDLRRQFAELLLHGRLPLGVGSGLLQLLPGTFHFGQLLPESARVIFQMAQLQMRVGQLRLGLPERLSVMADTPADQFELLFDVLFRLSLLRFGHLRGLQSGVASDDDQHQDQRPHGANQHG